MYAPRPDVLFGRQCESSLRLSPPSPQQIHYQANDDQKIHYQTVPKALLGEFGLDGAELCFVSSALSTSGLVGNGTPMISQKELLAGLVVTTIGDGQFLETYTRH